MSDDGVARQRSAAGDPGQQGCESLLRAEVGFWRELLQDGGGRLPSESLERVQQALALAEYKLQLLFRSQAESTGSSGGPGRKSRGDAGSVH